MKVNVLFFGVLKDLVQEPPLEFELADGSLVRDLIGRVRNGREGRVWDVLAVAVNREYAGLETVLRDGDEVALLPPVSGGCGAG